MISATSVKERLKNITRKENKTMQDCLVSYAMEHIEFAEVIDIIKELLCPVVDAVEQNKEFNMIWHSESGKWEKSIVKAPNNVPIRNGLEKQ